jgi:hypothetical protein
MTRAAILVLVVACLALAGVALAQAKDSKPQPPYVVEPAILSDVGYQLTGLAWRIDAVDGHAGGGRYRLLCASSPLASRPGQAAAGSGCCCTYLPAVMRDRQ